MTKDIKTTVWIDSHGLKQIMSSEKTNLPININFFKCNPTTTTYTCHKPVKIKLAITAIESC